MEEEQLKSNTHSARVVYTADGKLLIKFKNITPAIQEDHANTNHHHHHRINHACHFCLKEFSSVNALRGHMRVHADDKKTDHVPLHGGLYCLTCSLCDKRFPSTKALSGHMRCHPDRDWRGIHPPPPTSDHRDLITGLRGRTETSTSPSQQEEDANNIDNLEEEFRIAASELLWLAQEKPINSNTNSGGAASKYSASAAEETGADLPKTAWSDQELDSRVTKMESSKSDDDGKTRVRKGQNLKIYETEGLYMEADSEKFRVRKRQRMKSTTELASLDLAENYKCSTCNKCFPSHQALGGHRSSHNKFKMVTINSMNAAADHDRDYHGSNPSSAVPHQCKICDRVFNTGQALGGHQRCHYFTGPAASQTQSNSESKRTIHDFDLNEVPNDDDDCGDCDRALSASYNSN